MPHENSCTVMLKAVYPQLFNQKWINYQVVTNNYKHRPNNSVPRRILKQSLKKGKLNYRLQSTLCQNMTKMSPKTNEPQKQIFLNKNPKIVLKQFENWVKIKFFPKKGRNIKNPGCSPP